VRKIIQIAILLSLLASTATGWGQTVIITEVMSRNNATVIDEDGDFSDWIELYNPHSGQVDLTGFSLTDDPTQPGRWTFPPFSLNPGDRILVFASGKDRDVGPFFHTNFKLSGDGEPVLLIDPGGQIVSELPARALRCNQSLARIPDTGTEVYELWSAATPWQTNDNSVAQGVIEFSEGAGYHLNPLSLTLQTGPSGYEIRYSINGSDPTVESAVYSAPLNISNLSNQQNHLSTIPTTRSNVPENWDWEAPQNTIRKVSLVKARAFLNGNAVGPVYAKTYFVGSEWQLAYDFPIISIAIDSTGFFSDSTGIYVPGIAAQNTSLPFLGNYDQRGLDWERPFHFEYFDRNMGRDSYPRCL